MRRSALMALVATMLVAATVMPASAAPTAAYGDFTASVDFETATLRPVGRSCLFEVSGTVYFTGTLDGKATGGVSALVFAPCADVAANPPGTFRDVFQSELEFAGKVAGAEAEGDIRYLGRTAVGGAIDGRMVLSEGLAGVLRVDAVVVQGGSYDGRVRVR